MNVVSSIFSLSGILLIILDLCIPNYSFDFLKVSITEDNAASGPGELTWWFLEQKGIATEFHPHMIHKLHDFHQTPAVALKTTPIPVKTLKLRGKWSEDRDTAPRLEQQPGPPSGLIK